MAIWLFGYSEMFLLVNSYLEIILLAHCYPNMFYWSIYSYPEMILLVHIYSVTYIVLLAIHVCSIGLRETRFFIMVKCIPWFDPYSHTVYYHWPTAIASCSFIPPAIVSCSYWSTASLSWFYWSIPVAWEVPIGAAGSEPLHCEAPIGP